MVGGPSPGDRDGRRPRAARSDGRGGRVGVPDRRIERPAGSARSRTAPIGRPRHAHQRAAERRPARADEVGGAAAGRWPRPGRRPGRPGPLASRPARSSCGEMLGAHPDGAVARAAGAGRRRRRHSGVRTATAGVTSRTPRLAAGQAAQRGHAAPRGPRPGPGRRRGRTARPSPAAAARGRRARSSSRPPPQASSAPRARPRRPTTRRPDRPRPGCASRGARRAPARLRPPGRRPRPPRRAARDAAQHEVVARAGR